MQPVEILEDLYFVERGYLNANHFVFVADKPVLVDTAYIVDVDQTLQMIADLGVNVADTQLIISTHCHCDHIGGNKLIQDKSGCDIALHKIGKYFIDTRDDWSTWWRYYNQRAEFFNCTRELNDGDDIPIGPHEFKIIHTPGHASDGIVLYNRREKVLISSDTLWENDSAVMTLRVEGSRALFDMQESLEKIEALDVQIVCPGHGQPFTDMKRAIAKSRERIKRYFREPDQIGNDLIKKILVYTLMMKKTFKNTEFFPYLMGTYWFRETVDLYFNGEYEMKYNEIIKSFLKRGIVKQKGGSLFTTVKP